VKVRNAVFTVIVAFLASLAWPQAKPTGVLPEADLKRVVPTTYFYRGENGTVQLRNAAGIRTRDQKYVIAGLIDTSGYAAGVAEKYQGFLITEVKLKIEGSELAPGQYGFGFTGDKFVVTDVGANDLLSVTSKRDDNLKRPVPLKIVEESEAHRLYAGKKYVTLQVD
jgi:hypothetical protein